MATVGGAVRDLEELALLRRALAKVGEYQQGRVRVRVEFNQQIASRQVREVIDKTAAAVIRNTLNTAAMKTGMTAILTAKITALEAKYPGLVD